MDLSKKATIDAKKTVQNIAEEFKKKRNVQFELSQFECAYPNSVLRTTNINQVRDHCQSLLRGINSDQLFTDPDFKADQTSIYSSFDKVPVLPKVNWRRPNEISLKRELVGFDQVKAQTGKQQLALQGSENTSENRVHQGEHLDDRWLLNALMMVAAEDRQYNLLTLAAEPEIIKFREQGMYVFRFFKAGTPIFVIIDDQLPTYELANGRPVPLFSRCANPNLFWVSLIEKAYAKLHGRYFALQGGTTDEALEDLLGYCVENCFIDSQMTDAGSLKLSLQTLCQSHCIIGLKIDMEMFAGTIAPEDRQKFSRSGQGLGMSDGERQKFYNKAKSQGLAPFHIYTVLDIRNVQQTNGQSVTLVRLQNPWADGPEWNGRCSDKDDNFWTPEIKEKFNSQDADGVSANPRYTHSWYQDDGIFCMMVEDVLEYFTQLVVCRDYPENFFAVEYDQKWNVQKGFIEQKQKGLLQDTKQFVFTQEISSSTTTVTCTAVLSQEDPRMSQAKQSPYAQHRGKIGIAVFNLGKSLVVKQYEKVSSFDPNKLLAYRSSEPFRTTVCQFQMQSGKYALLPICESEMTGFYKLRLFFNTEETNIKFHSEYMRNTILTYGKSRSTLFQSTLKQNSLTKQFMTPYTLDTLLNKQSTKSVISNQKSVFEQSGTFYEDNAPGSLSTKMKLVSEESIQMNEGQRYQALIGLDGQELQPAPAHVAHQVLLEIENEVDLSYYYLNNDAFIAVLPVLEVNHLLKIQTLNLTANTIDDDALIELCDTLLQVHNTSLERLYLDQTLIGDRGVLSLIDTMRRITTIWDVKADSLKLSADVREKLAAACQKNQVLTKEGKHLNDMYAAARKRDDFDAKGIGYYHDDDLK